MTQRPTNRILKTAVALCLVATTSSIACAQRDTDKPPSRMQAETLIRAFFAVDGRTTEGHAARNEVLAKLAAVPPLDARKIKDWKKRIGKLWRKGRKLETSGDQWFWPAPGAKGRKKKGRKNDVEPQRGRYIVGGETSRPKGLAIAMHGGGVGSGDASGAATQYSAACSKLGWVMIAPQVLETTECGWTDSGTEEFVLELVDCALRTWKIAPDKVFLIGHSMGGYGSWTLGGHHADRVAAVAPSAGAPTPIFDGPGGSIIDIASGVVPSLRNVFVSVFQSTDDPRVPPAPNQYAVQRLRECAEKWGGFEHDYWEVGDRGHGTPAGGSIQQLKRVVDRVRDPVPTRIVWQPAVTWKRQFYWLYWESPVVMEQDALLADLDRETNTIHITCEQSTDGLYVLLDDRLVDMTQDVIVTVNGDEVHRGKAQPNLATLVRTSAHPDPGLQFVARVPAFGATASGSSTGDSHSGPTK